MWKGVVCVCTYVQWYCIFFTNSRANDTKHKKSTIKKNIAFVSTIHLRIFLGELQYSAFFNCYNTCCFALLLFFIEDVVVRVVCVKRKIFKSSNFDRVRASVHHHHRYIAAAASTTEDYEWPRTRDKKKSETSFAKRGYYRWNFFFIFFSNTQECCCCCRKSNKVHTCTKVWLTTGGGCFWIGLGTFLLCRVQMLLWVGRRKKNKDNYSFFLHFFSCLFVLFRFFV